MLYENTGTQRVVTATADNMCNFTVAAPESVDVAGRGPAGQDKSVSRGRAELRCRQTTPTGVLRLRNFQRRLV